MNSRITQKAKLETISGKGADAAETQNCVSYRETEELLYQVEQPPSHTLELAKTHMIELLREGGEKRTH